MTTDDQGVLLVSLDGAVATITLNRPDRGNGLTTELKERLLDALAKVGDDPSVRAVVLSGSGRAFCVGQDLGEHADALRSDASTAFETVERHYNPIVTLLAGMPKPVIAAINGACVGAGLGFALACDLRIAADTAKFGTAFTGIGLTCDSGLSATLALAVGAARASELVLLGDPFSAEQALAWGLVGPRRSGERAVECRDRAGRTAGRRSDRGVRGGQTCARCSAVAVPRRRSTGRGLGASAPWHDGRPPGRGRRIPLQAAAAVQRPMTEPELPALYEADAAARAIGIELSEVSTGRAVLRMRVTESMINGHGLVHGGYVFLLAGHSLRLRLQQPRPADGRFRCRDHVRRPGATR